MEISIYLPSPQDENTFFEEVTRYSTCNFIYGNFRNYKKDYPIVLIQWPEQLFKWQVPNTEELAGLKAHLTTWKKTSKIVYVVHNLRPHGDSGDNFKELYQLIEGNADAMIHFGKYSLNLYKKKYTHCIHKYINHPIYQNTMTLYTKAYARKKLGFENKHKIIVAPGKIRNEDEKKLIFTTFDNLNLSNKKIIIPRMLKKQLRFDFPGRIKLKKILDVKRIIVEILSGKYKKNYTMKFQFIDAKLLSLYISAADVVLIPRTKILNSGVFYLGLTFNKILVGPNVGNVKEHLALFNFKSFDPRNPKSISEAISQSFSENHTNEINFNAKQFYEPRNVAKEWDKFLHQLVR